MSVDLKLIREELRVTQEVMAALMGVTYRAYQALEYGNNPVRKVHERALCFGLIAKATGLTNADILVNRDCLLHVVIGHCQEALYGRNAA